MLGRPGSSFHLEFTRRRGPASRKEAEDQLLVFYLPERETWQRSVDRLRRAGYQAVPSSNPYWDGHGLTFEDPDGNRVVLDNSRWSP
jgi:hypothetical protein